VGMNFFYIFLLFPFFVLGKSNLDFTLNNNIEFRSKEDLLKPINGELFLGNKDAKIKIVVFDSYSCIHCARFYSEIFPILEENYIKTNKIFFVHKEFPLDKRALFATKTTNCSMNKLETVKEIYKNQEKLLTRNEYEEDLLKMKGINKLCVQNFNEDKLAKQAFEYSKVLSIRGTPTVFINGEKFEKLSKKNLISEIDRLLNE